MSESPDEHWLQQVEDQLNELQRHAERRLLRAKLPTDLDALLAAPKFRALERRAAAFRRALEAETDVAGKALKPVEGHALSAATALFLIRDTRLRLDPSSARVVWSAMQATIFLVRTSMDLELRRQSHATPAARVARATAGQETRRRVTKLASSLQHKREAHEMAGVIAPQVKRSARQVRRLLKNSVLS